MAVSVLHHSCFAFTFISLSLSLSLLVGFINLSWLLITPLRAHLLGLKIIARSIPKDLKSMAQTLEAIRDGGGSIKVGTTGTVGALMSRELITKKPASQTPASSRNKSPTVCGFIAGSATSPKRMKPKISGDEASSSGTSKNNNNKSPELFMKTKHQSRKTHQIPILESDNISVGGTPISQKPDRKGPYMVEIVDIKCSSMDRTWASPIKSSLKKLGFTKLSESQV